MRKRAEPWWEYQWWYWRLFKRAEIKIMRRELSNL